MKFKLPLAVQCQYSERASLGTWHIRVQLAEVDEPRRSHSPVPEGSDCGAYFLPNDLIDKSIGL